MDTFGAKCSNDFLSSDLGFAGVELERRDPSRQDACRRSDVLTVEG